MICHAHARVITLVECETIPFVTVLPVVFVMLDCMGIRVIGIIDAVSASR